MTLRYGISTERARLVAIMLGRCPARSVRGREVHDDDRFVLKALELSEPREPDPVVWGFPHGALVQPPDPTYRFRRHQSNGG